MKNVEQLNLHQRKKLFRFSCLRKLVLCEQWFGAISSLSSLSSLRLASVHFEVHRTDIASHELSLLAVVVLVLFRGLKVRRQSPINKSHQTPSCLLALRHCAHLSATCFLRATGTTSHSQRWHYCATSRHCIRKRTSEMKKPKSNEEPDQDKVIVWHSPSRQTAVS